MKKLSINKLILLSLSTLAIASCSPSNEDSKEIISPIGEMSEHLQEGTLHEIDVKESQTPFITNGETDYKIFYQGDSIFARKAATFVASHLNMSTGALLSTNEIKENTPSDHIILFGDKAYQEKKGVPFTDKELGSSGYQILTKDENVYIRTGGELGYQQAAICFLKQVIGYNRYSSKIVTYTKDGKTMPTMNIVERPDFAFRTQSNKVDPNTSYEMGFLTTAETFFMDNETQPFHNSFDYLNPTEYQKTYPEWYSTRGNQICYTAHGNQEKYDKMVDTVYEKMVARLNKNKTVGGITFSIQDNTDTCECETCKASTKKYGAPSGAVVKFLNAVDDKVQAHLEEEARANNTDKRQLNILFFAYHKTEKPCVTQNADGTFSPTSEDVICNENVGPYIAPISASFTHSFYDDVNKIYADSIKGWGALSKKLYIWLYETNFSHYLYPLNSFGTMLDSYRFCYENNGLYMYNEGQHNQGATTCFGRFKEYFNSVSLMNVNCSYKDVVDDFFTNYFKEAKEPMLKYFLELQEQCQMLEEEYSTDLNGGIYNRISQSRFWPKKLLDRWNGYIEEGKKAIDKYKTINTVLYDSLIDNLTLESIFPRYALLEHYSGKYSADTLKNMRRLFRDDCQKLSVTQVSEGTTMENVFSGWDL